MKTTSFFFYFCAWSLSLARVNAFALKSIFSVTFLHRYKVLNGQFPLKFTGLNTLFSHVWRGAKNPRSLKYVISVQLEQQPSTSTQTTIRSCRAGLKLWSDNVNWKSSMYNIYVKVQICDEKCYTKSTQNSRELYGLITKWSRVFK